ncbi:MAG: hypothetical protein KF862_07170 [Chitinophagaceae bacterium]|nr:hypothetical protein [Chitinophagaceae bacterium]
MEHKNFGDTIAAFVGAAIYGTIEWYSKLHMEWSWNLPSLLHINVGEYLTIIKDAAAQILKALPFILVSGFLGVIVKKAAEDCYAWVKKKFKK